VPNPIRLARKNLLLRQTDLAKLAGISVRTIANVEKGQPCSMSTKRLLLKALRIPFEDRLELFPDPGA